MPSSDWSAPSAAGPVDARVVLPGSKSLTNRYLVLAALASDVSRLRAPLRFVYKFEYQARFGDLGTEHELCWVYVGQTAEQPVINTTEIDHWRWVSPEALDAELAGAADTFTPWFRMEWQRLRDDLPNLLGPKAATPSPKPSSR